MAFEVYLFGVLLNPISNNSATRAFRDLHVLPPNTVAIIRLFPRCAEDTKLNPAAFV